MSWLLGLTLLAILDVTNGNVVINKDHDVASLKISKNEAVVFARQFRNKQSKTVGHLLNLRITNPELKWDDPGYPFPPSGKKNKWRVEVAHVENILVDPPHDTSLQWWYLEKKSVKLEHMEVAFNSNLKDSTLTMDIDHDMDVVSDQWLLSSSLLSTKDELFHIFVLNEVSIQMIGKRKATFTTSDGYFDIWIEVCNKGSANSLATRKKLCLDPLYHLRQKHKLWHPALNKLLQGTGDFREQGHRILFRLDTLTRSAEFSAYWNHDEYGDESTTFGNWDPVKGTTISYSVQRVEGEFTVKITGTRIGRLTGLTLGNMICPNPKWDSACLEAPEQLGISDPETTFGTDPDTVYVEFMHHEGLIVPESDATTVVILKFHCDDQVSGIENLENQNEQKSKRVHAKISTKSKKANAKKSKKAKRVRRTH